MTDSVSLKSTVTGLICFNLVCWPIRASKSAQLLYRSLIGSLFFCDTFFGFTFDSWFQAFFTRFTYRNILLVWICEQRDNLLRVCMNQKVTVSSILEVFFPWSRFDNEKWHQIAFWEMKKEEVEWTVFSILRMIASLLLDS